MGAKDIQPFVEGGSGDAVSDISAVGLQILILTSLLVSNVLNDIHTQHMQALNGVNRDGMTGIMADKRLAVNELETVMPGALAALRSKAVEALHDIAKAQAFFKAHIAKQQKNSRKPGADAKNINRPACG